MINFINITLDEFDIINKHLKNHDTPCCEFSTSNIYTWNIGNELKYAIVDDQIVFNRKTQDLSIYSTPKLSGNLKAVIEKCMEDAKSSNKKFVLNLISETMKLQLEEMFPNMFTFSYNRNNSDYIYKVQDLIDLKGKKYHGKKNHINYFLKTFNYAYEPITKENIKDCYNMKELWAHSNYVGNSLETELYAVDIALANFEKFGLTGGLIRIDGIVKAFTIGEQLTKNTFVTHIEKADHTIRGLYPSINQQFAINELSSYEYVNREEDLGVEGLRKAKLSYNPAIIFDKYQATLTTD